MATTLSQKSKPFLRLDIMSDEMSQDVRIFYYAMSDLKKAFGIFQSNLKNWVEGRTDRDVQGMTRS